MQQSVGQLRITASAAGVTTAWNAWVLRGRSPGTLETGPLSANLSHREQSSGRQQEQQTRQAAARLRYRHWFEGVLKGVLPRLHRKLLL